MRGVGVPEPNCLSFDINATQASRCTLSPQNTRNSCAAALSICNPSIYLRRIYLRYYQSQRKGRPRREEEETLFCDRSCGHLHPVSGKADPIQPTLARVLTSCSDSWVDLSTACSIPWNIPIKFRTWMHGKEEEGE